MGAWKGHKDLCDLLCAAANDAATATEAAPSAEQQRVVQQALKRLDERAAELVTTAEQANANAARERGEDEDEDEEERARKVIAALTAIPPTRPASCSAEDRASAAAAAVNGPHAGAAAQPSPAVAAAALDLNDLD